MKIILDTDIGGDIDDAVCLAWLLARPGCELLGVTTVCGDVEDRAKLASALCRAAGRDIPIFAGTESPLLIAQKRQAVPQAAALGRWNHETDFPRGHAIEFLRDAIRRHPGEITLITIGPLTNIALLFALAPDTPALLTELVVMAGSFGVIAPGGMDRLECNIICDPHAAALVFQTRVPRVRVVGLDVTMQLQMPPDEVRRRFQAPLLQPVLDFAQVWFRERPTIVFHDPLAAVVAFEDDVCRFAPGEIRVQLEGGDQVLGMTHWRYGQPGAPHEIAVSVDAGKFFHHYFQPFERQ